MATQSINSYNYNRFKVRLDTSEYFDITLASDERDYDTEVVFSTDIIGINDGNRLPINLDLTNTGTTIQPNLYWGLPNSANTFTSLNYYNPNNEDLACYTGFTGLCDAGLTMIDNGVLPKLTGETLYYSMGVFPSFTHNPLYHDRRMKFHPVDKFTNIPNQRFSGKTKETVYNIVNKIDSSVGYYQELYGGFFQGFYKLHGYDYEVFPERVNKGWTMETIIKPRQVDEFTLMDHQEYLNDAYPDNAGMFFFFGARAENKFYHPASGAVETYNDFGCDFGVTISGATVEEYQRVTADLVNCFKTCGCADTANTASTCIKIYPETGKTVTQNNGLVCRGTDVHWTGETQDPRMDILSNGLALRFDGDPKNPKLCVKYIKYTGDCITTGTCETTGTTFSSGYCINEVCSTKGIYDVCGYPISEAERTLERWVMISAVFERYRYLDECDLLNVGGLGDIRLEQYTASTYGVTTNLIQPPQTHPGMVHDTKMSYIQWTQKWLNQVDYRRGLLKLYVNGYLFMIIEDFEEIIPHELNTEKEKQIGVPFNISWGGGTQGLRESLIPSSCTTFDGPYIQDPECMPNEVLSGTSLNELQTNIEMEPNFGGTFMGGISKFRMYAEPLGSPQIQHNFRVERDTYNLFDYWCPNCLDILTECYFDFNLDTSSCDFDFISNDISCEFGFNIVESTCEFGFSFASVDCNSDFNVLAVDCGNDFNVLPTSTAVSPTPTPSVTETPNVTPDSTSTPTPTPTPTNTPSVTQTPETTPETTPTNTPTQTQTPTHTPTATVTPSSSTVPVDNVQMNFYNDLDGLTVSRIYVNGDEYSTGDFPMSSGENTTLTGLSHNSGLVGLQIVYNYLSQNKPKYIYVYVDGVLDISPYTSTDITFTIGQTVPVQNNSVITVRQYSVPLPSTPTNTPTQTQTPTPTPTLPVSNITISYNYGLGMGTLNWCNKSLSQLTDATCNAVSANYQVKSYYGTTISVGTQFIGVTGRNQCMVTNSRWPANNLWTDGDTEYIIETDNDGIVTRYESFVVCP